MKSKLQRGLVWLIVSFVNLYFWAEYKTRNPRLWMDLQWKRLWAKFPILNSDLLHSSLTMLSFIVLILGSANNVQWLTFVGFIALAVTLVLGTVNLIYDL